MTEGFQDDVFHDRVAAGRRLGAHLADEFAHDDVVVLGLTRGGVPVAAEVAAALGAPLDVIVVRKLGVPFQPEVAMGAIAEGGARIVDDDLVAQLEITAAEVDGVERRERRIALAQSTRFRSDTPHEDLFGRTALIVDDGIATGATAAAACRAARTRGAARVVVAVPVAGSDAARRIPDADRVICLIQPQGFRAVGQYYRDFGQVSEDRVATLLAAARERAAEGRGSGRQASGDSA